MKRIIAAVLLICGCRSSAQQQSFDLASYTIPAGWKKQASENAIQLSKEDEAKGTYCLITLFRSVPGMTDSKANFDAAWQTIVKESMTVTTAPEMQAVSREAGWEVQTGYAPFESDGNKGVALLISSTGFDKMMNMLVLTNTDVYEKEMTGFIESIQLKKPSGNIAATNTNKTIPVSGNKNANPVGYAFTTTNFDDGWTSNVKEDWVEVTKGDIKVLLHYPKEGTVFPADPEPLTNAAWNILVAPRYSSLKNYRTAYISNYERPYIATGNLTDNVTGKQVFVVFFRQGDTGWIEFITTDKNSFMQYFKFDPELIRWDSNADLLKPLVQMANYNKFAIAASDFKGTWTSDFTGIQQLYNVYTGNYAGMNMHQSSQTFKFGAGNTYYWELTAVNGTMGNTKYVNVKSSGKFTILNNWQIQFSDIEGKPRKYDIFFSCIKGARLLKMNDAVSPGSGMYTVYGMK